MQYTIKGMRVTFPSDKVAERRPELFAVVHGEFHDSKGQKLTISRKEITIEMAQSPEFVLDIEKGKLSAPSGKRGRKAAIGATKSEIEKRLATLKG